jgi:phage terminase large subunit-like protein
MSICLETDYSLTVFPGGYSPAETALPGQWFDSQAAAVAIRFIEEALTFPDGEKAGESFLLEEWEREIVAAVFGWKHRDGTRRYREVYMSTARGNGKTPLAAAMLLCVLWLDPGYGKQLYSIATSEDQATIPFNDAKTMVQKNQQLATRADVWKKSIVVRQTSSVYKFLTARPKKSGLRVKFLLADELHEYDDRALLDQMKTAQGKVPDALTVYTTTAGIYDDTSICWEKYSYAKRIISGEAHNAAFLPVIYEVAREDDWQDEAVWIDANPNMGVTVSLAFLRNECDEARELPAYQNVFRRLYCNQWVEQVTRWMDMAKWDAAGGPVDPAEAEGQPFIAGVDLGECDDLSALARVFKVGGRLKVVMRFWLPEDALGKNPLYRVWADAGLLAVTDSVTHYDKIRQELVSLRHHGQCVRMLFDRYQAGQMTAELAGTYGQDGQGTDRVQYYGQGFASMTGPIRELEKAVTEQRIDGLDHPVLRWMAQNANAKHGDNLAVKLVKPKARAGAKKIDGLTALVMALGALPELKEAPSFKRTGGLRKL